MTPSERVLEAYARIADVERPEVWISLRPLEETLADGDAVGRRLEAGETLPLAGLMLAVKDNIDVAGLPTTAACPAFSYRPERSAPVVTALVEAGAIVLGKTNLDQFATGLVGTRSPYGAVRDAQRPEYVAGGSSSGSAVAVALEIADIALGTDTAGSGRVPAAFQGIVGVKPTRGLVATEGIVPASPSLDCVCVFARELGLAQDVLGRLTRRPGRRWPSHAPLAAPPTARVGRPDELPGLSAAARERFAAAAAGLEAAGHELVEIPVEPFLAAGRLLYEGAFVAERYASVGDFIERHPSKVDPSVQKVILTGSSIPARALVEDVARLRRLRAEVRAVMRELDAVLLPTTVAQPKIAEVDADPIEVNFSLGLYTNGANLLDLCALAVPAGQADGGHFGVTLLAPAFADAVVADLAADLSGVARGAPGVDPEHTKLFVAGAHRCGQPLNGELTARGGRLLQTVRTAPNYRMHRLATDPPRPGLVRVEQDGAALEGELWALPPAGFASFAAAVAAPMVLGRVRLEDGSEPVGFLCEPAALEGAQDITASGSWLEAVAPAQV